MCARANYGEVRETPDHVVSVGGDGRAATYRDDPLLSEVGNCDAWRRWCELCKSQSVSVAASTARDPPSSRSTASPTSHATPWNQDESLSKRSHRAAVAAAFTHANGVAGSALTRPAIVFHASRR